MANTDQGTRSSLTLTPSTEESGKYSAALPAPEASVSAPSTGTGNVIKEGHSDDDEDDNVSVTSSVQEMR